MESDIDIFMAFRCLARSCKLPETKQIVNRIISDYESEKLSSKDIILLMESTDLELAADQWLASGLFGDLFRIWLHEATDNLDTLKTMIDPDFASTGLIDYLTGVLSLHCTSLDKNRNVVEHSLAILVVAMIGSMTQHRADPDCERIESSLAEYDRLFLGKKVANGTSIPTLVRHSVRHNTVILKQGMTIFKNQHDGEVERYTDMDSDFVNSAIDLWLNVKEDPAFKGHVSDNLRAVAQSFLDVHEGGSVKDGSVQVIFTRVILYGAFNIWKENPHFKPIMSKIEPVLWKYMGVTLRGESNAFWHNDFQKLRDYNIESEEGKLNFYVDTLIPAMRLNVMKIMIHAVYLTAGAALIYIKHGGKLTLDGDCSDNLNSKGVDYWKGHWGK